MARPDAEVLADYLEGRISYTDLAANAALYNQVARALRGRTLPGIIEEARAWRRDPATWPKDIAPRDRIRLGNEVAKALANGEHPYQTARRLDMVRELDPQRQARWKRYAESLADTQPNLTDAQFQARLDRYHEALLNDRRRTITRTEQAYAQGRGRRLDAETRGKRWKSSISAGDSRVAPECVASQAQGWIPIEQPFASGADAPPHHVNCRCAAAYRTSEPGEASQRRNRAYHEQTLAAREGNP